jgi:hypothetical protein
MRIPWYAGKAMLFTFWNMLRAFKIFGGNGFGPRIEVMNFSKEDSARLYAGAKAQGASPFSAMTYASVKVWFLPSFLPSFPALPSLTRSFVRSCDRTTC